METVQHTHTHTHTAVSLVFFPFSLLFSEGLSTSPSLFFDHIYYLFSTFLISATCDGCDQAVLPTACFQYLLCLPDITVLRLDYNKLEAGPKVKLL